MSVEVDFEYKRFVTRRCMMKPYPYGADEDDPPETAAEFRTRVAGIARGYARTDWLAWQKRGRSDLTTFDRILKDYYTEDKVANMAFRENPMFAFLRKA